MVDSLAPSVYVWCPSRDSTTTVVTGNGFQEARQHILGSAWTVGSSTENSGQGIASRWTTKATITRRSVLTAGNSSMSQKGELGIQGTIMRRSMCADGFRPCNLPDAWVVSHGSLFFNWEAVLWTMASRVERPAIGRMGLQCKQYIGY